MGGEGPVVGGTEAVVSHHRVEGGHLDGGVERRVIVELEDGEEFLPVCSVVHVQAAEEIQDGPVQSFHLSIGLRVVSCSGGMLAVVHGH